MMLDVTDEEQTIYAELLISVKKGVRTVQEEYTFDRRTNLSVFPGSSISTKNPVTVFTNRLLSCQYCHSVLYEPIVLGSGLAVCKGCVVHLSTMTGTDICSSNNVCTLLSDLARLCYPVEHNASKENHKGYELYQKGQYIDALTVYTSALSQVKDSPALWLNRSTVNLALDNPTAALRDVDTALSMSFAGLSYPSNILFIKSMYERGCALQKMGKLEDAITSLCVAVAWEHNEMTEEMLRQCIRHIPRYTENNTTNVDAALLPVIREKLDCPVCYELLHEPTALPCGHLLCRACVARILDQAFATRPSCPLCRSSLSSYLRWLNYQAMAESAASGSVYIHYMREIAPTEVLMTLIKTHFADEMNERSEQYKRDEAAVMVSRSYNLSSSRMDEVATIPIFVCSLVLPGTTMTLRIFEPRYRLMVRRCIESATRSFGMVNSLFDKYGGLVVMTSYNQQLDGTSIVEVRGTVSFRIIEFGSKDGYSTAKVVWQPGNGRNREIG
eukprot:CFRG4888T1